MLFQSSVLIPLSELQSKLNLSIQLWFGGMGSKITVEELKHIACLPVFKERKARQTDSTTAGIDIIGVSRETPTPQQFEKLWASEKIIGISISWSELLFAIDHREMLPS